MIKIAITGGIATGKSLVEKLFRDNGAATLDTDEVVHDLLENNKSVINKVKELFSSRDGGIINHTGYIDRKKIGKIVFNDKQALKELENILHPEVKLAVKAFFAENNEKELAVVSVPLLYEAGMEKMFDYVIVVITNDEIRLERLIRKRGMTQEDALKRMSAQDFRQAKIEKADFVIENNSFIENVCSEIERILRKIKAD